MITFMKSPCTCSWDYWRRNAINTNQLVMQSLRIWRFFSSGLPKQRKSGLQRTKWQELDHPDYGSIRITAGSDYRVATTVRSISKNLETNK